jgi:hypothetical protein
LEERQGYLVALLLPFAKFSELIASRRAAEEPVDDIALVA